MTPITDHVYYKKMKQHKKLTSWRLFYRVSFPSLNCMDRWLPALFSNAVIDIVVGLYFDIPWSDHLRSFLWILWILGAIPNKDCFSLWRIVKKSPKPTLYQLGEPWKPFVVKSGEFNNFNCYNICQKVFIYFSSYCSYKARSLQNITKCKLVTN